MKQRGFEIAKGWENKNIHIPKRSTKNSAAYDIEAAEDIIIPVFKPGIKPTLIPTGLKAYCQDDEWYMLANRSSGPKKGFIMANSIGIIDSDYYENETNDGHFYFQYFNFLDHDLEVKKALALQTKKKSRQLDSFLIYLCTSTTLRSIKTMIFILPS